jgi:hypothetical protein
LNRKASQEPILFFKIVYELLYCSDKRNKAKIYFKYPVLITRETIDGTSVNDLLEPNPQKNLNKTSDLIRTN